MLAVHFAQQVELFALRVRRGARIVQPRNHRLGVEVRVVDVAAAVLRRQERAGPQDGKPHGPAGAEHHVAREVRVLRAEAVAAPRTHRGHAGRHGAVVHQEQGGAVVRVVRVDAAEHAEVVGELRGEREQFADGQAGLTVIGKLERHRQQPARGPLRAQVRARGPLPGELGQVRLGVEEVRAERAAIHEQVDDPLGARPEVRHRQRRRVGIRQREGGSGQRCEQAERAHAATETGDGGAAGEGEGSHRQSY